MSRWISFVVLLGVIIVIAAFFVRVMAEFLVPLFVALLLVVIFRPVNLWFLKKTQNRPAWSALLTTCTVVLAVVLPFGAMLAMAAAEGREIAKRFDKSLILQKLDAFRSTFGLNVSYMDQLTELESTLNGLRNSVARDMSDGELLSPRHFTSEERDELTGILDQMLAESARLGLEYDLQWPPELPVTEPGEDTDDVPTINRLLNSQDQSDNQKLASALGDVEGAGQQTAEPAVPSTAETLDEIEPVVEERSAFEESERQLNESGTTEEETEQEASFLQLPFASFSTSREEDNRPAGETPLEQHWFNYIYALREARQLAEDPAWDPDVTMNRNLELRLRAAIADSNARFRDFKVHLLGGPLNAWIKELVNPQDDDVQQYSETATNFARDNFVAWGGTATVFLGRLLFGGVIAIVAVYFFLLDGPSMMASLMQLSPMDDRHEQELIDEFERVSRAVVLATLVAAVAQGILAGFGFYFAGIQSVFLLTMLTMLLAMIPFFGAASVWVPVVLYVAFFENRPVTAVVLLLYCALIVSTIDNVIKPYILHGQSNLHPLLALLSVLGGVTALGAIGILLGPMLVAFLQTLLKILRDELVTLDNSFETAEPVAAISASGASIPGESNPESTATSSDSPGTSKGKTSSSKRRRRK